MSAVRRTALVSCTHSGVHLQDTEDGTGAAETTTAAEVSFLQIHLPQPS